MKKAEIQNLVKELSSYDSNYDNYIMTKQEISSLADELLVKINYTRCSLQLPTIIEIDFNGHLKCQIETTDKTPTILKAVNGYGQPVDCNKDKIRINEI